MYLVDFEKRYDLSKGTANGIKFRKTAVPAFYMKNRRVLVDENWFLKRANFRHSIIQKAQEQFFALIKNYRTFTVAKLLFYAYPNHTLRSWNTFLRDGLFRINNYKITNFRISIMMWRFFRLSRAIINNEFRANGILLKDRDLMKIWEK